jgi:hypothetical protein
LSSGLLLDEREAIGVVLGILFGSVLLEQGDLVVEPVGDLFASELELSLSVADLEVASGELARELSSSTEDTPAWSWDTSACLIGSSAGVANNTVWNKYKVRLFLTQTKTGDIHLQMVAPISTAVLADMRTWTPQP